MNELDSFTVNFITNGLDKLQDGIKDLRSQMDSLDTAFQKGSDKGNSFFSNFSGWITSLAGLAAGFLSIKQAIEGVFGVTDKIIDLNLTADRVGRTALEVETLSRAMLHFSNKTDVKDMFGEAEKLYGTLNTITGKAWRLQFGNDLTEELNRAGGIMFTGDESDQEMIKKIIQGLEYHTKNRDWYGRDQLAKVLGLSNTAVEFLSSGEAGVSKILQAESQKAHLYTDDNLKSAQDLIEARRQLKDTWDKIYEQLQPEVTKMINAFNLLVEKLEPVIKILIGALAWLAEKFGWLMDKSKEVGEKLGSAVDEYILSPIRSKQKAIKGKDAYYRLFDTFGDADISNDFNYNTSGDLLKDIVAVKSVLGKAIENTPETQKILELAGERARELAGYKLVSAGRSPINATGNVTVETINITGMGEKAALDTRDALGKYLGGTMQAAYNEMGDL